LKEGAKEGKGGCPATVDFGRKISSLGLEAFACFICLVLPSFLQSFKEENEKIRKVSLNAV
jgi:hypothetical protein